MSFLNVSVAVPLWVLLLMVVGMIPLLFQVLNWLKSKGILNKADIVIDGHMKIITPKKVISEKEKKPKRHNEVNILKLLSSKGDQGMLLQSAADSLGIESNAAKSAFAYLEGKKLVEKVEGMSGNKFFLTQPGKSYCEKKGYIKTS